MKQSLDDLKKARPGGWKNILLAIAAVAATGSLLLQLYVGTISTIALNRKPFRLVELQDGKTIEGEVAEHWERQPQTIDKFTRDIFGLLFTWTGQTQDESGNLIPDAGVEIYFKGKRRRLTTPAWQGTFAFTPENQGAMQLMIAELTPPTVFEGGKDQIFLQIDRLTTPSPIAGQTGYWKQILVDKLVHLQGGRLARKPIAFNKQIYLRAIDVPQPPAVKLSALQQAIFEIKKAGLEIYDMEDFRHGS